MIELRFQVSCDHIGCKETVVILIDWSDVVLDLNAKKIRFPVATSIDGEDWSEYTYHGYGENAEERHYCPKHPRSRGR